MDIPYVIAGQCGIVATIEGKSTDQVVALRADIDALPIQEKNDVPYASKNPGIMHACGHDGHMAMLLGAAKVLKRTQRQLPGTVKLCFQQAEEIGAGAREILAELEKFPVKSVFAIHLWSQFETGKISVEAGPRMAGSNSFVITVKGKGCHGSSPDKGADPIMASAAIIMNLGAMISREVDPLHPTALSFGMIHAGEMGNIIPETAVLRGGMRNLNAETRIKLRDDVVPRMVKKTAEAFNTTADITWTSNLPVAANDPACSAIAEKAAINTLGREAVQEMAPVTGSENFSFYLEKYPGVLAFIGVKNDACGAVYPHHHHSFAIDEDMLAVGSELHVHYVAEFFNSRMETR